MKFKMLALGLGLTAALTGAALSLLLAAEKELRRRTAAR